MKRTNEKQEGDPKGRSRRVKLNKKMKCKACEPFAAMEPALMYLTLFLLMYITGPGKYSIDGIFARMMKEG